MRFERKRDIWIGFGVFYALERRLMVSRVSERASKQGDYIVVGDTRWPKNEAVF